jgi:hypothetical protein
MTNDDETNFEIPDIVFMPEGHDDRVLKLSARMLSSFLGRNAIYVLEEHFEDESLEKRYRVMVAREALARIYEFMLEEADPITHTAFTRDLWPVVAEYRSQRDNLSADPT